jgi:hypothetical protein
VRNFAPPHPLWCSASSQPRNKVVIQPCNKSAKTLSLYIVSHIFHSDEKWLTEICLDTIQLNGLQWKEIESKNS